MISVSAYILRCMDWRKRRPEQRWRHFLSFWSVDERQTKNYWCEKDKERFECLKDAFDWPYTRKRRQKEITKNTLLELSSYRNITRVISRSLLKHFIERGP